MVRMDLKGFHPKKVKRERLTSTDPPFCPPPRHHPQTSFKSSGPGGWRPLGKRKAFGSANWSRPPPPRLGGGLGTRPRALGVDPGQTGLGAPARRPFLPGPLLPHILHTTALQWHKYIGCKGSDKNKTKVKTTILAFASSSIRPA